MNILAMYRYKITSFWIDTALIYRALRYTFQSFLRILLRVVVAFVNKKYEKNLLKATKFAPAFWAKFQETSATHS